MTPMSCGKVPPPIYRFFIYALPPQYLPPYRPTAASPPAASPPAASPPAASSTAASPPAASPTAASPTPSPPSRQGPRDDQGDVVGPTACERVLQQILASLAGGFHGAELLADAFVGDVLGEPVAAE